MKFFFNPFLHLKITQEHETYFTSQYHSLQKGYSHTTEQSIEKKNFFQPSDFYLRIW